MVEGLFIGLTTVDLIYEVDKLPNQNQKIRADSLLVDPGGPAFNAARAFAHLGGKSQVQSLIGEGPFRKVIETSSRQADIQLQDLSGPAGATLPVASILLTPEGDRTVISQAKADGQHHLNIPSLPWTDQPDILLVDGYYPAAALPAIKAASTSGIPVVMDGGSWKVHTREMLPFVDILICSADYSLPNDLGHDLWAYCLQAGVAHLAITHGGDPVEYWSVNETRSIRVPEVEIVDTLGAGDVFHGAFCWYYLETGDVIEGLRKAGEVASESCRFRGASGWVREWL